METKKRLRSFFAALGPGLITGISDDDPSGIVTYSQSGAQYGLSTLWTMIFSYPLMCAVQLMSAMLGRVTGQGIAKNLKKHYSKAWLYPIIALLFVANTINIGADIGAMADVLKMLIGGSNLLYACLFALVSIGLEILVPYHLYVKYLKWLTLVLFAYVAAVLVVHVPWKETLLATFIPHIRFTGDFLKVFVAILGTTISPYLFFWQASEEVEDLDGQVLEHNLKKAPREAPAQIKRIRFDTFLGMACSNIVAYFIILTTAVTLHTKGITNIESADQAAKALEPIAGKFCFLLFSLGVIGTGLLAIPVLAGATSYAMAETFDWPIGLEKKTSMAKGFYWTIALSTLLGLAMIFLHLNPMSALIWSAVINGVVAVPIIALLIFMVSNPKIMGPFTISMPLKIVGGLTFFVMLFASIGLLLTSF